MNGKMEAGERSKITKYSYIFYLEDRNMEGALQPVCRRNMTRKEFVNTNLYLSFMLADDTGSPAAYYRISLRGTQPIELLLTVSD